MNAEMKINPLTGFPDMIGSEGGGGGNQPQGATAAMLITQPILIPNIDGTSWLIPNLFEYQSNGVLITDVPAIPAMPNPEVDSFYGRFVTLYIRNNGGVSDVFWVVSDPIFLGGPTPPINTGALTQTGAVPIASVLYMNFSPGTKTIGVDSFAIYNDGEVLVFEHFGQQESFFGGKIIQTPGQGLTVQGELNYSRGSVNEIFPDSSPVEIDFLVGQIIPDGAYPEFYVTFVENDLQLLPSAQVGGKKVAWVQLQNTTGSDREFGLDSWDALQITIKNYTDEVGGGGGGGGNTDLLQLGYNAALFDYGPQLVRVEGTQVLPLLDRFDNNMSSTPNPTSCDNVAEVALDAQTIFRATTTTDGGLRPYILKYDGKGNLRHASGASQSIAGVDNTIDIFVSKVSHNKVAVSFVDAGGTGNIVLYDVQGENPVQIWGNAIGPANDCAKIQVFEGTAQQTGPIGDYGNIVYGYENSDDGLLYVGYVEVDNNWQYVTYIINALDILSSTITADPNRQMRGCGYGSNTTGVFVVNGAMMYYGNIVDGVMADSISFSTPAPVAIKICNIYNSSGSPITDERGIACYMNTFDVLRTKAYWNGSSIGNYVSVTAYTTDVNRLHVVDIAVDPTREVAIITSAIDLGGGNVNIQQILKSYSGSVPSSVTVNETDWTVGMDSSVLSLNSTPLRIETITSSYVQLIHNISFVDSNNFNASAIYGGYRYTDANGSEIINFNDGSDDLWYEAKFRGLPNPKQVMGLIGGTGSEGDFVTVYLPGSTMPNFGTIGQKYYNNQTYIYGTTQIGDIELGEFVTAGFYVTLIPTQSYQTTLNGDFFTNAEPYNAIELGSNQMDLSAISDGRYRPITLKAKSQSQGIVIPNIDSTGRTGMSIPGLYNRQIYVPFGKQGDTIVVQREKDYAMDKAWNVIGGSGEGLPFPLSMNPASGIYDSNALKIPYQYSTIQKFVIDASSGLSANADIDNIKGMPVGSQFMIQNDSAYDVTFYLQNFGANEGEIIDGSGVSSTVTLTATRGGYAVFEVRSDYRIVMMGAVSF